MRYRLMRTMGMRVDELLGARVGGDDGNDGDSGDSGDAGDAEEGTAK